MTTTAAYRSTGGPATERYEQVVIEGISPSIDGGRHPVKGIVGDTINVEATVFKHGHDRVRAALRWAYLWCSERSLGCKATPDMSSSTRSITGRHGRISRSEASCAPWQLSARDVAETARPHGLGLGPSEETRCI